MPSYCLGTRSLLFGSLLCLQAMAISPTLSAQDALTNPTLAAVYAQWQTPPALYGPEPYYGLNGPVTLEVVERDLDRMQKMGFRSVTVQYGYGSGREYLSAEYMAFFRQFLEAAKKRGMHVWIVDDAGYPSGFAGGKFTTEHPELRMQALAISHRTPAAAHQAIDLEVHPATVAVTAIRDRDGARRPVAIQNGHAHWAGDAESWTLCEVEHIFRTSPTRSDTNPKRTKDATQSLEDYLDPAATAQYLAFTHEAYKKAVGDEFGKTILGFRGDEPDYSIPGLPWTPRFFSTFEQRKGYDIRPYLAAFLLGPEARLSEEELRAKADYYDVFSMLFRDGFFKPQADWCTANHLQYQVHLNHEERQLDLARSEGDFFRDMRYVQQPGVDAIWHQIWTDTISDFPRLASSAAHVYGHRQAFTESFAAYRPAPDLAMARYILNEQFVRGINLIEVMYLPASSTPHEERASFMTDAGFPALMHSAARLSYLMSQGHPAASVALLLPAEGLWMGDKKADSTFVSAERMLSEHQVDFDIVDEDAIGSLLPLSGGSFVSASGNHYRTVLVPATPLLPEAVWQRLHRFSENGGKVVFLEATPARIGGSNTLNARLTTAQDFAWARVAVGTLPEVPTPPAQPPAAAPEPMHVPTALWKTVAEALPPQSLKLQEQNPALRITERILKDGHVYLLFNESAAPLDGHLALSNSTARHFAVWNPEDGSQQTVTVHSRNGDRVLPIAMKAYTTLVVVARN